MKITDIFLDREGGVIRMKVNGVDALFGLTPYAVVPMQMPAEAREKIRLLLETNTRPGGMASRRGIFIGGG